MRRLVFSMVLLEEELLLRACRPAHLVVPELPCKQLRFHWERGQLRWQVEGGTICVELSGHTMDQSDSQVYLPCRLAIEPQLDEAELLGRKVAGCTPCERLVLELADPSARTTETC
ncbi:MAG: hypothetical protein ACUVUC_04800 [Thermoguttaceae bacterium]